MEEEPKEFLDDDYFGVRKLVTVKSLFEVGAHLGHKTGCRDPYMAPFLFGTRFDLDIIDLEQTKVMMQDALNFAAHIAYRGGVILFASRYRQTLDIVEQTAKDCGEYAHCRYWRGGSFTNSNVIYKGATRLPDLCIFVSVLNSVFETHTGVIDSAKLLIPTIGIVDTNCDPRIISYPIPANDDTPVAIKLYCELFKQAILAGKEKKKKDQLVN
ncbi:hypothetical protein LOTGIDRAFT_113844 [Lottia gigantea]|uniref:Small ribosomal subunit protein uS2m n=1 Tax=Lottia gigantea TaxID=225164 RepID=V4A4Q5_LOTGI|nr:hypothetical protein LOTGIDRAFT_113844 [Lottia gigantea]ESO98858.1 hypothetical protein LOTGIDRAFT_113844 [Lottia gigantea]